MSRTVEISIVAATIAPDRSGSNVSPKRNKVNSTRGRCHIGTYVRAAM